MNSECALVSSLQNEASLDLPSDPALPGLSESAPESRMLAICREVLTGVPAQRRTAWTRCDVAEAVYQPARSCRIAYRLYGAEDQRPDLIYARWDTEHRPHASAVSVAASSGAAFQIFRYPRDRRMREIRSMQRDAWLRRESQSWFQHWLGPGRLAPDGWRCTPVKYVPESRLVCRLKGQWTTSRAEHWARAYVRIARRDDAHHQFALLHSLEHRIDESGCGFSVPHALGVVAQRHLLSTEFVRGETLREAARVDPGVIGRACGAMAAIAKVVPADSVPASTWSASTMDSYLADLAFVSHELRIRCEALAHWSRQLPPAPQFPAGVHGDLHAGQVIFKGDRMCVVDWEAAGLCDPTRDIVNLAAEFDASDLRSGLVDMCQESTSAGACVAAWRSAGGLFNVPAARWWAVHANVLRAWGLLRHLRRGWHAAAAQLLERAARIYANGTSWTK